MNFALHRQRADPHADGLATQRDGLVSPDTLSGRVWREAPSAAMLLLPLCAASPAKGAKSAKQCTPGFSDDDYCNNRCSDSCLLPIGIATDPVRRFTRAQLGKADGSRMEMTQARPGNLTRLAALFLGLTALNRSAGCG